MNDAYIRISLLAGLGVAGALSAIVISEEELEANKPQPEITHSGSNLRINWESQPDTYYFAEGTADLETWITAKLLKDNAETGSPSGDSMKVSMHSSGNRHRDPVSRKS